MHLTMQAKYNLLLLYHGNQGNTVRGSPDSWHIVPFCFVRHSIDIIHKNAFHHHFMP